jgi:hypothetical protein
MACGQQLMRAAGAPPLPWWPQQTASSLGTTQRGLLLVLSAALRIVRSDHRLSI